MTSNNFKTEQDLSDFISEVLKDKKNLFDKLVKYLGYKSSGELLLKHLDDEKAYLKNPELFFHSTLFYRQEKFINGHKSFFEKLLFDLFHYNLYSKHFESLLSIIIYELLNREFNPDLSSKENLIKKIRDFENLERRLVLKNLTVSHYISHLYRLLENFQIEVSNRTLLADLNNRISFNVFRLKHSNQNNFIEFSNFLYTFGFIENPDVFIRKFVFDVDNHNNELVVWKRELHYLCFLFKALFVFNVIDDKGDNKLWKKISENFISIGKSTPKLRTNSLSSINSDFNLSGVSASNIEDWVINRNDPLFNAIYSTVKRVFEVDT